jgi:hypothetical protein
LKDVLELIQTTIEGASSLPVYRSAAPKDTPGDVIVWNLGGTDWDRDFCGTRFATVLVDVTAYTESPEELDTIMQALDDLSVPDVIDSTLQGYDSGAFSTDTRQVRYQRAVFSITAYG